MKDDTRSIKLERFASCTVIPGKNGDSKRRWFDRRTGEFITLPMDDEPNCGCFFLSCSVGCPSGSCRDCEERFNGEKAQGCERAEEGCQALVEA